MRIGLVGGIFDKPASYRAKHSISPETILADGLRERGWEVIVRGHHQPLPLEEVDLVHVHHFGRAALRMAVYPQRPAFVFTSHDPFAMNGLPVGWRRRLTDGLVLSRADAVVALSAAERDFLVRHYGVPRARITVIPNGINTQIFDRVEGQGGEELLFVGQLEAFKGLDYLLEALPAVRERFPQLKLRAVYHTAALLERYRQETARLGIRECVEFAGSKTAPELAELYSTAAIVVHRAWVRRYRRWYWRPCAAARQFWPRTWAVYGSSWMKPRA